VRLEGSTHLVVLFRVAQKAVGKVRTFSADCELDAGGVAFHWLTDVRVNESLALLERFASANESDSESRRVAENSVSAIALHSDAGADAALERLSASDRRENVRRQAIFWMGNARGRRGYDQLLRILREDPGDKIRERAIFALTQSKEPDAVRTIISVARDDKSAHVRGQALFWLAQKAGREATAAISEAIENDPETEVKRRAVFALSQLPKDEGVPMLIQVARSNRNPAVRKQAMFWLGQSKDPRAVKFFEDVLTR
jgi:HEAT repeat protein